MSNTEKASKIFQILTFFDHPPKFPLNLPDFNMSKTEKTSKIFQILTFFDHPPKFPLNLPDFRLISPKSVPNLQSVVLRTFNLRIVIFYFQSKHVDEKAHSSAGSSVPCHP